MNGNASQAICESRHSNLMDTSAMGVSLLCLVHCLVLPFALALFPAVIETLPGGHGVHLVFLALALPLGIVSLGAGWRAGRIGLGVFALGLAGLGLLGFGLSQPHGSGLEAGFTSLGSLSLLVAHGTNFLRLRKAACC